MNWNSIHYGHITTKEIRWYVTDAEWQTLRIQLKNKNLSHRFALLSEYLRKKNYSRPAQVVVTNYINALARGGMIDPVKGRRQ